MCGLPFLSEGIRIRAQFRIDGERDRSREIVGGFHIIARSYLIVWTDLDEAAVKQRMHVGPEQ
jgi:hypothetical protein